MRTEMKAPAGRWWRTWRVGRWLVVALVLAFVWRTAIAVIRGVPGAHNMSFEFWYGDWREVLRATALFLVFVLGFARPRRRVEWRNAGLYSAFLISLFVEMFGIPLTIYLLAPALGLPALAFGMNESHLWAFALDRLGLLPLSLGVYLVMTASLLFIASGMTLVAVGWVTVYRGRHRLVTEGIYRFMRHPQYVGLIVIILGFNVMWPTLLTLLMAPVLVVMYVRLARREDEELATVFGEEFLRYADRTPGFVPWGRPIGSTRRIGMRWIGRRELALADEVGRLDVRPGALAALVGAAGAMAAAVWRWRPDAAGGDGYQVVARWAIPGGEGRFVAIRRDPGSENLRALADRMREDFSRHENAVAMIFDDVQAARDVRRGSRNLGEERFRVALRHQRAMYLKHTVRGEESLVVYTDYPTVRETLRYPVGRIGIAR